MLLRKNKTYHSKSLYYRRLYVIKRHNWKKGHYLFVDKVDTWEEAIRMSCKPLEKDGTIEPSYAELIIECVQKYGPYIVLFPNYAIPH